MELELEKSIWKKIRVNTNLTEVLLILTVPEFH